MSLSPFRLRIYHDHITEDHEAHLSAERRIIYCVSGGATLRSGSREEKIGADDGWFSDRDVVIRGGAEGAQLWRWELVAPDAKGAEIKQAGIKSTNTGDYALEIDTAMPRFMRLDRVSFPLGGEALTHVHAAAGVRCLLSGSMLIESIGLRYRVWPGDSWVEHGPDEVYAKASAVTPTSFVRVMIVPESHRGKSTITYVRPEDRDKPKSQSYKRYVEEHIVL